MHICSHSVLLCLVECERERESVLSCWTLRPLFRWPWPGGEASAADSAAASGAAADVLGMLMKQPTHGPRARQLLSKLLPPGLVAALAEGPAEAVMHALGQVSFSG